MRAKDAVNTVWWFSKTEWPKADISKVLTAYSSRMKKLLSDPESFYKPKVRPSGHDISAGFAKDNGGAGTSKVLQISKTRGKGQNTKGVKAEGNQKYPSSFPERPPAVFMLLPDDPTVLACHR